MSKTIETIVWSKMQCPYCDMAKALLKQKNIEFKKEKLVQVGQYNNCWNHIQMSRVCLK